MLTLILGCLLFLEQKLPISTIIMSAGRKKGVMPIKDLSKVFNANANSIFFSIFTFIGCISGEIHVCSITCLFPSLNPVLKLYLVNLGDDADYPKVQV